MTDKKAYSVIRSAGSMFRLSAIKPLTLFFFLCLFFSPALSQQLPDYDEIAVFVKIPRTGGMDIDAVIRDDEIWLPVTDLFSFLKIHNVPSPGLETIKGFFINPDAVYEISREQNRITYQDKVYQLQEGDLIRTETNLYLRASYYGKIFGLECTFSFRTLSVTVTSDLELPYISEMRREEMRRNLSRVKGEIKADTNIARTYPLFRLGMADWSVIASEEIHGKAETRINLDLGSMLAGGELTTSLYFNSASDFSEKQQKYLWRYVNNDFTPLRQVIAGKIRTNAISTIYNPVIGVQLTNTPTTYRRSFGTYTLTDQTEPGWIVELYVNNVLIDYVTADASGFYSFEIPLVYGNSIVNLKFYSPWGEERTKEQNINIPFNFLPHKVFEYNVGAGIVEDTLASRFSRGSFSYGLTNSITLGGGAEYLSSLSSDNFMPFLNTSVRLTNNLLLSGEYTHGVRAKGTLSYRMPSNIQLDVNYIWYAPEQKAINLNYREERKASLSIPLKIGNFSSFNKVGVTQTVVPAFKYTTAEWLFSASLFGVNTSLTTYSIFREELVPQIYSNLSLAFRVPGGFVIRPQTQYSFTYNRFLSARVKVERPLIKNSYLTLSYEQNFRTPMKMAELGFRYDFSFAQSGMSVRQTDDKTSFTQYARGSLIRDRKTKYLGTDNRTNVGRGGITLVPYLDLNANGKKDKEEPKVSGLNIKASSGRIEKNEKDSTIRVLGLEPYTDCFIELDPNSFENISWRLKKKSLSVAVDPNILKTIEIPVLAVGEATGEVKIQRDGFTEGLERIIVSFFTASDKPVAKTLTEIDGFYSYFGLTPGDYYVRIDTAQLNTLGMLSEPETIPFNVKGGAEGDIIYDLNFTVTYLPDDTSAAQADKAVVPEIRKDTTYMIIHEVVQELVTISEDSWAIQLGAFRNKSNAEAYRRKLHKLLGKDVEIVVEDGYYKVRILDLKTREEVDRNIELLRQNGVTELWVIRLKAKQQQLVLTEKVDSIATVTETITGTAAPIISTDMVLQAGAFRDENNAVRLRDKLSATINKPVVIVPEEGYYKVRVTGFETLEEIEKMIAALGFLGHRDIWIPSFRDTAAVAAPGLTIPPDTITEAVTEIPEIPVDEKEISEAEPTVALQVGVFQKKRHAVRAQRKIISRLDLPVEIVEQWGYYHVIVTGFFTREETYAYYPELAGLGYPGITLIENYKSRE